MARRLADNTVVVVGLGRFGTELAATLMDLGRDVLAIERDPELVERFKQKATLVVQADATSVDVLRDLGVASVETAVVAIGTSLEASVLTTLALHEVGVQNIWAKAVSGSHEQILQKVGATHIVFPELAMGRRVARLLAHGDIVEYVDFANGYAISIVRAPSWLENTSVAASRMLTQRGVSCVGIQRSGSEEFSAVTPRTIVRPGDKVVIAGRKIDVDQFRGETV